MLPTLFLVYLNSLFDFRFFVTFATAGYYFSIYLFLDIKCCNSFCSIDF